jgi:hypothetical protein
MFTPKKVESNAPIYNFYDYLPDKEDSNIMKYYCKSCGVAQSAPTTSNLIKHITKTKLDKHKQAIDDFNKLIAMSPINCGRNAKRQRLNDEFQVNSPMSKLCNDLVKMDWKEFFLLNFNKY